jgi:hypothetical protein
MSRRARRTVTRARLGRGPCGDFRTEQLGSDHVNLLTEQLANLAAEPDERQRAMSPHVEIDQ